MAIYRIWNIPIRWLCSSLLVKGLGAKASKIEKKRI